MQSCRAANRPKSEGKGRLTSDLLGVVLKTAYFLRGLPASGKTTWAKKKLAALNKDGKRKAARVNKDEIRARLIAKGSASEGKVIKRETELVAKAMNSGLCVIIDNTHFNPIQEWRYRDLAEIGRAHV